jgi:hypothetical protein
MLEHFCAHTVVHLKFLARSRILLGFGLLVLLVAGVGFVPALFIDTAFNRFEVIKGIASQLHDIARFMTGGIGLFVLWSHRRNRTIKMVATKPSPFGGWVASIFASAALVGLAVHAVVAVVTLALSLSWGVPYQIGFVYLAGDRFVDSLIILAVLTALGAAFHPILAVLTVAFFNESTFRYLGTTVAGALAAGYDSVLLRIAQPLLTALYYISPSFDPFANQTEAADRSLRIATIDWRYLAASAGYAVLVCACGYLMTLLVLRRRPLT